jgi:hypothetical protein
VTLLEAMPDAAVATAGTVPHALASRRPLDLGLTTTRAIVIATYGGRIAARPRVLRGAVLCMDARRSGCDDESRSGRGEVDDG